MKIIRTEKRVKISAAAAIIILALLAAVVIAAGNPPYFTPAPPSDIYCYQNSTCFYDFNATDGESDPFNFSIEGPLASYINADTGIFNFTPTNSQVKDYNFTWVIVKDATTGDGNFAIVTWHILNINDPPELISYYPENITNVTTKENAWELFNASASDIDDIHGDVLTYTWLIDGKVNRTLLNFTDTTANYTTDFFSAGIHNITVNISDTGNASVMVNWTVNVTNENRLIINNDTIQNISMVEDITNYSVINLSDYFYDLDLDDYPLSYDVVGSHNLTFMIDTAEPNNVTVVPDTNYFGDQLIWFRAYDGYNYTLSNNLSVNVTGVNDPPTIIQAADQLVYANIAWQLQINANDVDFDILTFYDNTSLFNINPSTGFITDTPTIPEIGFYVIQINVSDGIVNTSMDFNLTIVENEVPVIGGTPLPDITIEEGQPTSLTFNATDADTVDTVTLSTSSSPSSNPKFAIIMTNNSAENATGYMSFTPEQVDVGEWTVTLYATDNKGAQSSETFMINITNVEHNPVLTPIPNQRMKVNLTYNLTITAEDIDGNINGFEENTSLFNITLGGNGYAATGFINFTPNDTDFGEHWVEINVTDSAGRVDTQLVLFNVTYNEPPEFPIILNQTGLEDSVFIYELNATDIDPQDTLIYFDNTTMFDVNETTGDIIFTPVANQTGEHIINITVSDTYVNVSRIMNLTIGNFNDYPYWDPDPNGFYTNLTYYINTTYWNSTRLIFNETTNMTIWNSSLYEKNYTHIHLDAVDEEYGTSEFGP
ncbi:MAG: putative Ig domain-containing protein, partial [Candidatus Woesearchaeota archaeon]